MAHKAIPVAILILATAGLPGSALAGNPRESTTKDVLRDPATCRIVISARGLTVDSEYSFILHATTDRDSFNYTVNMKAAESTFESRAISIGMAEGTRLTLTVRNLTDPDAPAIATSTADACSDRPRGAIRPAWR